MWGGSIRENKFLIFWLACLEVAVSLHVMRPRAPMQDSWWRVNVVKGRLKVNG